jgi:hypothetical protein
MKEVPSQKPNSVSAFHTKAVVEVWLHSPAEPGYQPYSHSHSLSSSSKEISPCGGLGLAVCI